MSTPDTPQPIQHFSPPPNSAKNTVRVTLSTLWRRRWLILIVWLLVMSGTWVYVQKLTPKYTAHATVILDQKTHRYMETRNVVADLRANRFTIRGQVEVIKSHGVAKRVIEDLNLMEDPAFIRRTKKPSVWSNLNPLKWARQWYQSAVPSPKPTLDEQQQRIRNEERVLRRFLAGLSVRQIKRSPVLRISYTSNNKWVAARIANAVANAYVDSQLEAKFEGTRRATMWLSKRIEELRSNLHDSERAVVEYQAKYGIVPGGQAKLTEAKISDINTRYILSQSQRAEAEARYKQVTRLLKSGAGIEAAGDVVKSPVIRNLADQETELQQKLAELSNRYGKRHPKIINANIEMKNLRAKMKSEVRKIADLLRNELALERSRERAFRKALREVEGEAAAKGSASVTLRELERQAQANRLIYESFLSRFKETSQQQEIQQADARILSGATVPRGASYPRKGTLYKVAFGLALFLAIGLALFLESLDVGLKSADQIEELTGLPVVSMVPSIPIKDDRIAVSRYVLEQPVSSATESVRNLLTSLRLSNPDSPPKIVSFTSTVSSEGKSTLCLWAGRVAAASGQRVVVIDCDLRRPKLHISLGLDNENSLSEYLAGDIELQQCLHQDTETDMQLIAGKAVHGKALEMLGSKRFKSLLKNLRTDFDLILIDAPPILAVSDAQILAHSVDTTVFLARWNSTHKEAVVSALKQFSVTGGNLLGIVVSQVDTRKHARYGYGDYGDYYGKYQNYYHEQS